MCHKCFVHAWIGCIEKTLSSSFNFIYFRIWKCCVLSMVGFFLFVCFISTWWLLPDLATSWNVSSQQACCLCLYRYSYRDSYAQSRGDDRGDGYSRGATSRGEYPPPRSDLRDSPRDSYGTRGADGYSTLSSRDYREPLSSRGGDRFDRLVHI